MEMIKAIRKIVIANRGEIVNRIRRSAEEMDIKTVVLYSHSDRKAQWVTRAAEAYSLGNGSISDTYLNISRIIELSLLCGADAIHPGYGFLSENPLLAEACLEHNITFIGPSPDTLKRMGDKMAAHEFVRRLGIAVPERISGFPDDVLKHDVTLTFPVLVKAVAGGGGKGMRLVKKEADLKATLATTASEAFQYFGDERIYLEQYLPAARHIEVQIMGDHHGNVVHLSDRECSVQRRHQKIIEEAPAIFFGEKTRWEMGEASLKIARALHYIGAGTVEFLLDDQGKFYFLEMNPRIQVEHGITEMITGIDIVKEQISIASGHPLTFLGRDITPLGHAVEVRIYAEDPENDMLPSPGQIHLYKEPALPDIRIESAYASGDVIPSDYDPLIAKVLVHGPTREQALEQLRLVLQDFIITGVRHNLPLLREILQDDDFNNNLISTRYLENQMPVFLSSLRKHREKADKTILAIAAAIHVLDDKTKNSTGSPWHSGYWRNTRQIGFGIDKETYVLGYVEKDSGSMEFFRDDQQYTLHRIKAGDFQLSFLFNDLSCSFYPVNQPDGSLEISDGNLSYRVSRWVNQPGGSPYEITDAQAGDETIVSPLPGKVYRIHASAGDLVNRGDILLTIESMKLENDILAAHPGIIQQILTHEGDQVSKEQILLKIKRLITN